MNSWIPYHSSTTKEWIVILINYNYCLLQMCSPYSIIWLVLWYNRTIFSLSNHLPINSHNRTNHLMDLSDVDTSDTSQKSYRQILAIYFFILCNRFSSSYKRMTNKHKSAISVATAVRFKCQWIKLTDMKVNK